MTSEDAQDVPLQLINEPSTHQKKPNGDKSSRRQYDSSEYRRTARVNKERRRQDVSSKVAMCN